MKKHIVFITFSFLIFSMVTNVKSENVTAKTAQTVAQSFLNSKIGSHPEIHMIEFAEKYSFSGFYVFGNEHCFVIIAANDCVHPVLGYSTENAFGVERMPENVYAWLKAYNEDIASAVNSKAEATDDIREEWNKLLSGHGLILKSRSSVAPLVRTTWNQTSPYNNLCPEDPANDSSWYNGRTPTGCMATAMAQVLNYWEHPVRGVGLHSYIPREHPEYGEQYADFGATIYDWDNMKNSYSDGYTEEEANAVAILMYHCGVAVDMNYTPTGSGGGFVTACDAFKTYFNYNPDMRTIRKSYIVEGIEVDVYTDEAWVSMLKTELNLNRPLCYMGGYYLSENESGSHAFVCDGYDENDYFHFNWGWGGSSDGYYAIGAMNTGSGNTQQWNQYNSYFSDCYPCIPSINPPTDFFTTVNERNVNIQWNNAEGAVSYKLYRDGDLVANNLTSTNYTDGDLLYGTYSYYVKSVAADGTVSLRSDISIANVSFSGPVPTNLQATLNNHNANLSWAAPESENAVLHYGIDNYVSHCGYGGSQAMYWAQRYPAQTLVGNVEGMAVNKISVYYSRTDNIVINAYIYKGDSRVPEELLFQTIATLDNSGWQDISVNPPVPVDYMQDLWIVFYADSTAQYPAAYCNYTGEGQENALYLSLNGTSFWKWNQSNRSWMIKTYATDGTYTYNLYRNNTKIADEITATAYQDNNLPDDHYVYYVTTNYYGGESDASNEVEVMVGNPQYNISATANPSEGGFVLGGGTFGYGQPCTLTATPNTDYIFLDWTEDDNVVSTNATYSFIAESDRDLTANFVPQYCLISVSPSGGGSVSGGGTYQYGQTCTLAAVSNAGYVFEEWTKDGEMVSTNPIFTFPVTENATYTANFTNAPTGTLNGLFSVGDSKQVRFSQGNLQYQASTDTWRFAENQLSYVGGSNSGNVYEGGVLCNNELISSEYDGWIDLFGWGTSGFDHGAVCYQPWSTSTENTDYYAYNNTIFNLYDETGLADWGANPIVNGKNTPNFWRTLKVEEWQYLFNLRPGTRYAKAKVDNLKGVVLLPDNWDANVYGFNNPNLDTVPFESNMIALEDWNSLEAAGAVFLPAVGVRHENSVSLVGSYACYWSSSRFDRNNNCACCVVMYTDYFGHTFNYRNNGYAVRLVSDYSDIIRMTNLSEGWNWWSSNIEADDLFAQLTTGLGANAQQIKSSTTFVSYFNGMWFGGLNSINNESCYLINANDACTVEMTGNPAAPDSHPITINPNWNWIGYPNTGAQSVANAFSNFSPANGDQVKSQNAFSTYFNGMWVGGLQNITPGMGLLYKSNSTETKTLIYPEANRTEELVENVTNESNHWTANYHAYPNNMTVMAVVELDDVELQGENYEIAAFANGECRGSARLMYVEPLNRYVAFLTIVGDEASELRFSLYDSETGMVETQDFASLQYETNAIVGSIETPYVICFRNTTDIDDWANSINVFPNPTQDVLVIEGKGIRRVNVSDILGQTLENFEVKEQEQIRINVQNYRSSPYILRILTENGLIVKRFIKKP